MQSRAVRSTTPAGLIPQLSETSPWQSPNNITTFVRCLRLLDLDRLTDWPGITENVFITKPAQQNLQARIKAVEWSLYRLLVIYNPKETQTKLRPFFPPLAPLQSLNLRAALYRALTELKKNGALGRDVVLRKTMLDECKGEKFEEVISTLALVVLRHVCRSRHPDLDLDQLDQTAEEQLVPMIIAHRQSLQQSLQQHRTIAKRAEVYSAELQTAEADTQTRMADVQKGFPRVEEKDLKHLSDMVRRAWVGDEQLADILLQGKTLSANSPLRTPFESSWLGATDYESSPNGKQIDLAAELEARVEEQKHRLQKWKTFHASMKNTRRAVPQPQMSHEASQDQPTVDFEQHRKLQFSSSQIQQVANDQLQPYHASVLKNMREELDALTAFTPAAESSSPVSHPDCAPAVHRKIIPRTSEAIDNARATPIQDQAILSSTEENIPTTSATEYVGELNTNPNVGMRECNPECAASVDMGDVDVSPGLGESSLISRQALDTASISSSPPLVLAAIDEVPFCLETELDGKANVLSGAKCDLLPTLHERTQASLLPFMLKLISPEIVDDPTAEDSESETSHMLPALPDFTAARGTLLERTRQSMSLLPNPPPKCKRPRHSVKQPRFSEIFPISQFETPSKSQAQQSGEWLPRSGSSTPRDTLFSEEADYASVFKSRPRIAVSPSLSPERSDLGLESMLTTGGHELELEDTVISPSRRSINHG